jgi:excisionase family DNA binding protein
VANDEPATATDAQPEPAAAPAPSGETLSVDQAVAILGVSRPTIYKLIESGELPASKKGRSWRISAAAVSERANQ